MSIGRNEFIYLTRDLLKAFEKRNLKLTSINEIHENNVRKLLEDPDYSRFQTPLYEHGISIEAITKALRGEFSAQIASEKDDAVKRVHGDKHYDLINPLLRLKLNGIENVKLETAHEGVEISEIPGFLTITIDPAKFNDTKKLSFTGMFKGEPVEFVISPKGDLQALRGTFDQSNTATITLPTYIELPDKEIPLLEKPSNNITLKVTKDPNTREVKFQSNTRPEESIETNDCMITVNGRPCMSPFILEPAASLGSAPKAPSERIGWLDALLRVIFVK